jgi:hypothetical protein
MAKVFVQRLRDDAHIRTGNQFRSVDAGEEHFGDLLSGLLLQLNRRDVFKIEIGLGLLKEKKPCHLNLLLSDVGSVKRTRPCHPSARRSPREAIDRAGSRVTLHLQ